MGCIMLSGPCLDSGLGTALRYSAKRASVSGAAGNAGMDMIDICEERKRISNTCTT